MERASVVDPVASWPAEEGHRHDLSDSDFQTRQSLRFLTFNIQVGIKTTAYTQYLTKGWKHLFPHLDRAKNLQEIARIIRDYDVVSLQEIDAGSIRSGFINQVEFLAQVAGFPYWYTQLNRDLGPIAQHGNGLLSRVSPRNLEDHKLPGVIPGRGAMFLRLPLGQRDVVVVMMHLSLGERSRRHQLDYIAQRLDGEESVVIMGDMNTPASTLLETTALRELNLMGGQVGPTYPAWEPKAALDHILVSPDLSLRDYRVLDCQISDHLPIAVEVAAEPLVLQ
ncbi:MAG: endonuclease/exonuclease/phosphatase family protein [Pseudomonadota bacterium]